MDKKQEIKPVNNNKDLYLAMVQAIEAGINKHINRSLIYSPFKLFYRIFTSANPNLMQQVREYVANDINNNSQKIDGFKIDIFLKDDQFSEKAHKLLQVSHNIGIHLFKKELTPITAFKLVSNPQFRSKIYSHLLETINRVVSRVTHY